MKHDAMGFLVGDRINTPPTAASPALSVLGSVRRDVTVIRRLLETRMGRVGSRSGSGERRATSTEVAAAVATVTRRARAVTGAAAERSAGPVGARQAVEPRPRDARGRFVRGERSQSSVGERGTAVTSSTAGPSARTAAARAAAERKSVESERDARGRFSGGGTSDFAGQDVVGRIAGSLDSISQAVTGAENIDPTIAALKEVRDVVSPVGRGIMALHNRATERKRDRWFGRILKAITGRKGDPVSGGGTGDVSRGSFLGTFLGELMGNAARMLPAVLAGAGGLLLKGLGLLGAFGIGQYIGGKIYEWLDQSGIATKVFDAFDAVGKWFREKIAEPVKNNVVKPMAEAFGRARDDVSQRNGARISSGMMSRWGRAKKTLKDAADHAGVDPGLVAKIAAFESGFDPNAKAPTSSAHGYGQFIDSTWVATVNKHGGKYGVQGAGGLSKAQALALRNDPKLQAAMLAELTKENVSLGRSLGGANDDANVYALHNLGTGDGSKFLRALRANPSAPISSVLSSKVIANNPSLYGGGKISVQEAYGRMGRHMAAGNLFAAEFGAVSGPAVSAAGVKSGRTPAAASATVNPVRPGSVPMPVTDKPAIVQAAPVPERLGSSGRPSVVVISKDDVNQDVRDRRLAHIVTGGVGG